MSKTAKDTYQQINRRDEQIYNDKYGKLINAKQHQHLKREKKMKNAIRCNDIDALMDLD